MSRAYPTNPPAHHAKEEVTLLSLADELVKCEKAMATGENKLLVDAIKLGKVLLAAKKLLPPGGLKKWFRDEPRFVTGFRQAQNYKRIAEHEGEIADAKSVKEALRMVGGDDERHDKPATAHYSNVSMRLSEGGWKLSKQWEDLPPLPRRELLDRLVEDANAKGMKVKLVDDDAPSRQPRRYEEEEE